MSISDIDNGRERMTKAGFVYLAITLFCVLFGAVYEYFSHEVYSYYMIYAFVIPLVGGVLPFFVLGFGAGNVAPGRLALNLYNSGVASLTVGSIFMGVLEIYGTTNRLIRVYLIAGTAFILAGVICFILENSKKKAEPAEDSDDTDN